MSEDASTPRSPQAVTAERVFGEWGIPTLISFILERQTQKGKGEEGTPVPDTGHHWALPASGPQVDTTIAEETRNSVQAEEIKANEKARKAQAIADDAQKDLDEALPALDAALASLRNLNKNDVTEVGG